MHPLSEVTAVLRLVEAGVNDCEIARRTGIPRATVRDWRRGKSRRLDRAEVCGPCEIDHGKTVPPIEYAYLLGQYLGDGCISQAGRSRSWVLRIASDTKYPGIIDECAAAMQSMFPNKRAHKFERRGQACVAIAMYSMHWPCLFPQHGPGKKHLRPIVLTDWQRAIVEDHPGALLRGLIHSDGCRFIARERKGDYVRDAPRYVFSNLSDDIKHIFCSACELLDIEWTRPNFKDIAVYRVHSVMRMDKFVGPKY
jgi:hypothetical protein